MLAILAAMSAVSVTEICAVVVTVAGALKLVLGTVEAAQRVQKNVEKKE